jgi:hypothetical protein
LIGRELIAKDVLINRLTSEMKDECKGAIRHLVVKLEWQVILEHEFITTLNVVYPQF